MHYQEPEAILKQIAQQYGITIITQPRLKGLILDMMPTAERKYINVLKRAIDEQIGTKLLEMQHDDPALRQIKINTLKEKFKNDNAFDDTAFYIIDCFIHALGWNNSNPEIILPFKEIKIGNQIWADRNLDVSHFRNGDPIPEARTDEEWNSAGKNRQPAWCYYENDIENGKKYGKLYNWYAVNDKRVIAPKGWKVPSHKEFDMLFNFLGGWDTASIKLLSKHGWEEHENGKDNYRFCALPGGNRDTHSDRFEHIGEQGNWWFSDDKSADYTENLVTWGSQAGFGYSVSDKSTGCSLRCIKNRIKREELITFKEIQIGNQIWADRNLDVSHFRNGDLITEARTDEEWQEAGKNNQPAWCYYENDLENGKKYGKLYNWFAVIDPRGLAPEGWHVAHNYEWEFLMDFTGGEDIAGQKLKSSNSWKDNRNGNDEFGFSALPGGYRRREGEFFNIADSGYWWSATEYGGAYALRRSMGYYSNLGEYMEGKELGFSVRCLKDKTAEISKDILTTKKDHIELISSPQIKKNLSEDILHLSEIKIGNQIWADRNLDVSHFRNDDLIPEARTAKEWLKAETSKQPAWCYFCNNSENGEKYGKLYNWYAVKDPRGLPPKGWHIPSDDEWTKLIDFLGGEDIAGQKLKSANGWLKNGNGTDEFGFSAPPGGFRHNDGEFHSIGYNVNWWSATEHGASNVWYRHINYGSGKVSRYHYYKTKGFSVRCVRDVD